MNLEPNKAKAEAIANCESVELLMQLDSEMRKHPLLIDNLRTEYLNCTGELSLANKLATIAAYCQVSLDGEYNLVALLTLLVNKLRADSIIILH